MSPRPLGATPLGGLWVSLASLLLAGCATFQAYDGPRLARAQVAIVTGNSRIHTQLPLALVIRAVDGRDVGLQYAGVALTPGRHELLVDCQVSNPNAAASRHVVVAEVAAGESYRLTARMNPGNRSCADVALEPV